MTIDVHGNSHAPAGTTDGGKFATQTKPEAGPLARATPVNALTNPALGRLRKAALDAQRDADKATAGAIRQFAREASSDARTITLFKADESDSAYALETTKGDDGVDVELAPEDRRTIEDAVQSMSDDNLYLAGTSEWVEDTMWARSGYVLQIDLSDETATDAADLNIVARASDYGPLLGALQTAKDREEVDDEVFANLDDADMEDLYDSHMGRAVDGIIETLSNPKWVRGE